ncbi:hypothetical protein SANTM175S_02229 [Streptomyces antimycoticus]
MGASGRRSMPLNEGRTRPDGRALRPTPGLIRPGSILHLPDTPRHPHPGHDESDPSPAARNSLSGPSPHRAGAPSTQPAPSTPQGSSHAPDDRVHHTGPGTGISLPTGAFVSLGLAALISAVWLSVRRRRRMHYRPEQRRARGPHRRACRPRTPPRQRPGPPLLRLRRRHRRRRLRGVRGPNSWNGPDRTPCPGGAAKARTAYRGERAAEHSSWTWPALQGLGLVGPGALDALPRSDHHPARRTTWTSAVPRTSSSPPMTPISWSARTTTASRDSADCTSLTTWTQALDTLESELLTRAGDADTTTNTSNANELILVATPVPHAQRRMQAIFDNGSSLGLSGVLIGQWRPEQPLTYVQTALSPPPAHDGPKPSQTQGCSPSHLPTAKPF